MAFLMITPQGTLTQSFLSTREYQVLKLLAKGYTNRQIAALLFLRPGTVKMYVNKSYKKLKVHTKLQALRHAGLI